MYILTVADDLTGALEVGAIFASQGIDAKVSFATGQDASAVILDIETRHLSPAAAESKSFDSAVANVPLIYKKTDSTLRGNIGPEFQGLARAYGNPRIAYVPAYPRMGRTVRAGCLYVNGVSVHETAFGRDALNPVPGCRILDLLGSDIDCEIFDGETDWDVDQAAEHILAGTRYRIVAGPAAIAEALARRINVPRESVSRLPEVRRCLVVNGSRHQTSIEQINNALASHCIGLDDSAPWQLVRSVDGETGDANDFARATARTVRSMLTKGSYDALMVFGGDTAYSIVTELGCSTLKPLGEVIPGVACTMAAGSTLITKAGGFGGIDVVRQIQLGLNGVQ